MNYFKNKDELRKKAVEHARAMEQFYSHETLKSLRDTVIINDIHVPENNALNKKYDRTKIELVDSDTVSAIFNARERFLLSKKIAALNFASFKNPGGMFINGSSAQEEMLCHESNLYNILCDGYIVENFYKPNMKKLNNGMYTNSSVLTPDVLFLRNEEYVFCDVITCAAPNASTAKRYHLVSDDQINQSLHERTEAVLCTASVANTDVLILGAFGCGVFGNDPTTVASMFLEEITGTFNGVFDTVIFAVPKGISGKNYDAFEAVLKEYLDDRE